MFDIEGLCSGLQRGSDGIWYSARHAAISYPEEGHGRCFAIEDDSFWFRHRVKCISAVVQAFPPAADGTIFDIGGGNGYVSQGLAEQGFDVVLVEPGPDGARNAKMLGVRHVICATIDDARFPPNTLHAVGLFDVLEHIEDDVAFLKRIRSLLVKGGRLYLTVPAYPWLWSREDETSGHYRRYTLRSLSESLERAGFSLDFSTYIFRFLPLPIFLLRTLPHCLGLRRDGKTAGAVRRDHAVSGRLTGRVLDAVLAPEVRRIRRRSPIGFGGSCLVAATGS